MNYANLKPTQRFWRLLKPDQKEIRNVYIYAIFYGLVNLSLPVGIQAIINLIQGGRMSTSWVILVVFVMLGIAVTGILQIQQLKITEHLQQKIFSRAAFEFAYRIPRVKLKALYKHYAPELMNRFFDVVSVQKGLSKILIDFSTASIQTVFGLILLCMYHPFFIVFSLVLIVLIYVMFRLTSKRGFETSMEESKNKYDVAHWLEELARTSVSFKLAGITELPLKKTDKHTGKYVEAREEHFKILKAQYGLMIVFKVLVAAGLLVMGSILVMEQQMNIGQFVAAEIIILLVLGAVEKLVMSLETIYDVLTSLQKIGEVTDLELEPNEGMEVFDSKAPGGLEVNIKDMSFRYPSQNRFLFHEANLHIKPGEKVLLTGDHDSGKTTLLYLLAGLYKPKRGTISLDGIPIGNMNPNYIRSIIGDCLMDELLFEGTILENISMGREKATFENVQWAIEHVGLKEFLMALPEGYDTIIHPQGKQFSSGVVERLILARSIADKPKLLLIKDALRSISRLDRDKIMRFLTSPENNWTLVIVSQDDKLEKLVDRIMITSEKKIKEVNS